MKRNLLFVYVLNFSLLVYASTDVASPSPTDVTTQDRSSMQNDTKNRDADAKLSTEEVIVGSVSVGIMLMTLGLIIIFSRRK